MKKITVLLFSFAVAYNGFSQNNTPYAITNETQSVVSATPQAALPSRKIVTEVKSQGNPVNGNKAAVNGRADFGAAMYNAFGSSTFDITFANPIMPDSTTYIGYTSTTGYPTTHAVGMVYDPTEPLFSFSGTQFTSNDVVNVDTIFVDGVYFLNDPTDINDSLIITVMIADPGAAAPMNPFLFFSNLPTSFTQLSTPVPFFPTLKYVGSATHGIHNGLGGPITARYGRLFTAADTIGGAQEFAFLTPSLQIPAGYVMAVYAEYKPTTGWAAGDTTNLATGTGKFNAFRPLMYINVTGNTVFHSMYALEQGSLQHNSIFVNNLVRYNTSATNTNDVIGPNSTFTRAIYSMYAAVSGNSTVGVDELTNDVNFSVYPNPSNGEFTINLNSEKANTANLTVRNLVGQTIINKTIGVSGKTVETISLSDYSKGVYFLTIDNNTTKLVVE